MTTHNCIADGLKNNTLQIVDLYESKLYRDDHEFKSEDDKEIYYNNEFWQDCDYILIDGVSYGAVCIDNEIIIDDALNEILTEDESNKIIAFYIDDLFDQYKLSGKFVELSTWPMDVKESDHRMKLAPLSIKYHGGEGCYYGWWLLN